MMLETVQMIVVMGAGALTVLILLRLLFYIRAQNKKINDFAERLNNVEDVNDNPVETEEK